MWWLHNNATNQPHAANKNILNWKSITIWSHYLWAKSVWVVWPNYGWTPCITPPPCPQGPFPYVSKFQLSINAPWAILETLLKQLLQLSCNKIRGFPYLKSAPEVHVLLSSSHEVVGLEPSNCHFLPLFPPVWCHQWNWVDPPVSGGRKRLLWIAVVKREACPRLVCVKAPFPSKWLFTPTLWRGMHTTQSKIETGGKKSFLSTQSEILLLLNCNCNFWISLLSGNHLLPHDPFHVNSIWWICYTDVALVCDESWW